MYKCIFWAVTFVLAGTWASCSSGKELAAASQEINDLKASNSQLANKVSAYETTLNELKENNAALSQKAQECMAVQEAIQRNLRTLNNALAQQGTSLRAIREKADSALNTFYQAGADVTYKNGLLFITMNDRLLFSSGSTTLHPEGREALAVVGRVLNQYPLVKAIVVGNTDDRPLKSGSSDNWSLSTERANAVVRLLRDEYNVDPARLTAAGRGKYNPIADNSTEEGKAHNRRIEIVIDPDLSALWEVSVKK